MVSATGNLFRWLDLAGRGNCTGIDARLARFNQPFLGVLALLSVLAIVAMMLALELWLLPAADLVLGCVVAAALPFLALAHSRGQAYQRIAEGLAEISYTLYATHFPILMAATMIFLAPTRLEPGALAAMVYVLFLAGVLISAAFLWACFERHTTRIYRALSSRLLSAPAAKPQQN